MTGSGKTEVYLRAIAAARERGARVDRARARDRAHAAARRALPRALRRRRRRAPLGAHAARALTHVAAASRGRSRRRHRRPQRALRARARSSGSSSSTRSTTRASSRKKASATTRATWPSCARTAPAACACSGARRPRSRASCWRARAGRSSCACRIARAPQPMPRVELVDLRRIGAGTDRRQAHQHAAPSRHREHARGARAGDPLPEPARLRARASGAQSCGDVAACRVLLGRAHVPQARRGGRSAATTATTRRRSARCARSAARRSARARGGRHREARGDARARRSRRRAWRASTATSRAASSVEAILASVRAREVDILVGTQMVTKGHDLPHVTLVGVINADAALSIPDFRASERAFQLLVQVAGRAGRGDVAGTGARPDLGSRASGRRVRRAATTSTGFLERELADRTRARLPAVHALRAGPRRRGRRGRGARGVRAARRAWPGRCEATLAGDVLVRARRRRRWRASGAGGDFA